MNITWIEEEKHIAMGSVYAPLAEGLKELAEAGFTLMNLADMAYTRCPMFDYDWPMFTRKWKVDR